MTTYRETFSDQEWSLLVGLPQAVAVAASAAERDGSRRTLAEGTAGLHAIADGRESASPLVKEVAAEVIARVGGDPERGEEPPVVIQPADPAAYAADCLDRARQAAALLAGQVGGGDGGAYRHWLVSIAEAVVAAAPSGDILGLGGTQVTEAEQSFVRDLGIALDD